MLLNFFFGKTPSATLDKGRAEKKALVAIENKVFKQLKNTHERYADVFRELGYTIDLSKLRFAPAKPLNKNLAKIIPLQRVGKPENISDTVLFLLSEQSSFITGTEIIVDGGLKAKP